jgi:hypothetical protein
MANYLKKKKMRSNEKKKDIWQTKTRNKLDKEQNNKIKTEQYKTREMKSI